jgi:hypothetical protein
VLFRDGDAWRRERHRHLQRHHPESRVRCAADTAGLRVDGVYGMQPDGSIEPGCDDERNSKALYVLVRDA